MRRKIFLMNMLTDSEHVGVMEDRDDVVMVDCGMDQGLAAEKGSDGHCNKQMCFF